MPKNVFRPAPYIHIICRLLATIFVRNAGNRESVLARKTNYSFEKRQKELAKKKKKEEKRQRKLEKKENPAGEEENIIHQENELS